MNTRLPERNLDVLRALAVSCVLASHLVMVLVAEMPLFDRIGRIGVLLFFVHTSLVLMASLERLRAQRATRRDWIAGFYLRRAFRIYPLAIVTVLAVATLGLPTIVRPPGQASVVVTPTLATLLSNVLLVDNVTGAPDVLGVMWSLPLEVQMYACLPLCYLLARRGPATAALGLGVAAAAGAFVRWAPLPGVWRLSTAIFAPCFMAGVLAYAILVHRPLRRQLPGWLWPAALVACALAFFFPLEPGLFTPERGWPFCLAVGLLIPCVREMRPSWLTRGASTIAKYSYGIYLVHVPALAIAFRWNAALPQMAQWVLFIVLLVGLPVLAYRLIEAPGIRLGQRLSLRPVTLAATAPAP